MKMDYLTKSMNEVVVSWIWGICHLKKSVKLKNLLIEIVKNFFENY